MSNGGDGSIIALGYPDGSTNWDELKVFGRIDDMLKPDNASGHRKSPSPASCSNCNYIMNLNGRDASLKVDNIELRQWTLDN